MREADECALKVEKFARFLDASWENLDCLDSDGRITRDELHLARHRYYEVGRTVWASIIDEALFHYEAICLAHNEVNSISEELEIGMSRKDLECYLSRQEAYCSLHPHTASRHSSPLSSVSK